jgi:hypothetical protein
LGRAFPSIVSLRLIFVGLCFMVRGRGSFVAFLGLGAVAVRVRRWSLDGVSVRQVDKVCDLFLSDRCALQLELLDARLARVFGFGVSRFMNLSPRRAKHHRWFCLFFGDILSLVYANNFMVHCGLDFTVNEMCRVSGSWALCSSICIPLYGISDLFKFREYHFFHISKGTHFPIVTSSTAHAYTL